MRDREPEKNGAQHDAIRRAIATGPVILDGAMGTMIQRLGLTEENHEHFYDLDEDDPAFVHVHVYDWLTFLQETLVQAVNGRCWRLPKDAQ